MSDGPVIEQVVQSGIVTAIGFQILSNNDIEKFSSFTLLVKEDVGHPKLGLPNNLLEKCGTCGSKDVRDCSGHFGAINLPVTIYHPYFVAEVVQILNQICPGCCCVKQDLDKGNVQIETNDKCLRYIKTILKKLQVKMVGKNWAKTERKSNCKYCVKSSVKWYPMIRFKILPRDFSGRRSLQIVAEIAERQLPKRYHNKSPEEVLAGDFWDFVPRDVQQLENNKRKITLTPYQAFTLLKELDPEFIQKFVLNRKWIFLSSIPVTANSHRLSETYPTYADGPLLAFDERTKIYRRIIDAPKKIDEFREHPEYKAQFKAHAGSFVTANVIECFNSSKLHSRQQSSGAHTPGASHGVRWLKDILLSKRTDHVFRMVMTGDPKIKLGEIGISSEIAQNLLITEHANRFNLEKLKIFSQHFITEPIQARRDGKLVTLKKSNDIKIGDIIYRPVQNGDIVLINRPPSVHQHSLVGLKVKILPIGNVASINPINCIPLLGDFDGDCLHGYIPQSVACRVELNELVSIDNQLFNSQDGRCLVSLSQDSLLAASVLTRMDKDLTKYMFQQLEMFSLTWSETILNETLLTGLQLFCSCLPPDMDFNLFQKSDIVNGGNVLLCPSRPQWLTRSEDGIFYRIFKKYSKKGLKYLFRTQETLCEFLTMRGLTISLSDLYLSPDPISRKILLEEVHLAIEEAEDALKCRHVVLNPKMMHVSLNYDYQQEDFRNPISENLSVTKTSIGAFKGIFIDITKLVSLHVRKGNSIMEMINSGSKMNLLKLVHQTLCLGLQLPVRKFPFTIPTNLSCVSWNNHKAHVEPGQSFYAVIRNSFLDGLNPLECLLHAISGRASFSDNAEVPGTLNRELMYYLRDLYTAYDGTVRDACGQIVQFSFRQNDTGELDDENDVVGAPVGAWAASAVSEAAYGALDCPVNGLEQSPLMNLKKVLKCGKGRASTDCAGVLYISPNVQKCKYGPEYASLLIQSHLEPVHFSDLVNTVMILYGRREVQGFKNSPWEIHFHLNKDIMKGKRIDPKSVISRLVTKYATVRKSEVKLPALRIFASSCPCIDIESNENSALCLVATTDSSNLDMVKLEVIPFLLGCLVKGFEEFKRVEIKCTSENISGELFLIVTASDASVSGHLWAALQDACIPIMDLIDWTRSKPDTIHDIFGSLGIDSAWSQFLSCLEKSICDIGRGIKREHLMTVADSLSVSGEFHGLSSNGLKGQRKRLGLSAPFSQACFSGPASNFVTAAKEGMVDGLHGSLDSISWGKEPSIGSGGHFDLMFSFREHFGNKNSLNDYDLKTQASQCGPQDDKPEVCADIYEFLLGFLPREPSPSLHGHVVKKTKDGYEKVVEIPPEHPSIGLWANILDMHASLQKILYRYPIGTCVSEPDRLCLIEALTYHPRGVQKRGIGVKAIKIGQSQEHDGSRCFILVRNNGSEEDFSYRKCIIGAASEISSELKAFVETKLFHMTW
ncbi:DNA-directed RNA polymerase subunit [Rhynchospora pubera]|uniref:DNA-directed RNA polymerase subunit n=1 Tax=Rhynchospora pubera TaxID=906938 RepID=A0AAV8BWF1_9POAL|nr:DNA-directed RNA polymerase subunit [Rhynchospora pubera]